MGVTYGNGVTGGDQIDPFSGVPVYRQLADILRRQIVSGKIPPRSPVPSKRTLTQEHGIAGTTVDRAMAVLKDEGRLRWIPGRGLFVTDRSEWAGES